MRRNQPRRLRSSQWGKKKTRRKRKLNPKGVKLLAKGESNLNCDPGLHCSQLSSWYRETVLEMYNCISFFCGFFFFVEYLTKVVQTEKHVIGATNNKLPRKQNRTKKRLHEWERDKATVGISIFFTASLHERECTLRIYFTRGTATQCFYSG